MNYPQNISTRPMMDGARQADSICKPSLDKTPPLDLALNRLDQATDYLLSRMSMLSTRLEPLKQPVPTDCCESVKDSPQSIVVNRIYTQIERVDSVTRIINSCLEEIQI